MFRLGEVSRRDLYFVGLFFISLLTVATVFYHLAEGWSWVDAFYFSSTTLVTIGHAGLFPSTDLSKIFTVVLAFAGASTFLILIALIAGGILRNEKR